MLRLVGSSNKRKGGMFKLLRGMSTAAFLADCGCYHEAFELLKVLDSIAMGLELYWSKVYQIARQALITYIRTVANDPGKWEHHI